MGAFQDKVAVITGGTHGIGKAIAEAYGIARAYGSYEELAAGSVAVLRLMDEIHASWGLCFSYE